MEPTQQHTKKDIEIIIIKQAKEEAKSPYANDFLADYTSEIRQENGISVYDPDTNGWCGYCCLAYGTSENQYNADRLGAAVRLMLLETLLTYESKFEEFFMYDDFLSTKRALTMVPNDTTDWWFTVPDMIWIAVLTFKVTINKKPAFIISFFDTTDHLQCYRYSEQLNIDIQTHPLQPFLEYFFFQYTYPYIDHSHDPKKKEPLT
ncbi:hypothetical protein BD560DRAFT_416365 [Blakeslea trispora]|nr:hypothetical protein BD560DRAFT_416365 [Blakeslea trispora]